MTEFFWEIVSCVKWVCPDGSCVLWPEAQAFDGPAPETINGRAAMLGVFAGNVFCVFS